MDRGITDLHGAAAHSGACRLVIRQERGLTEVLQFVTAGLEIGQQVVALAGPRFLKDLALRLGEKGLKPESLLHNGRLVFLTAPTCIAQLTKPGDPMHRGPLHRNASLVRWVSDWSWAYSNGADSATILDHQLRTHDFIRSLAALSLCTVYLEKVERGSLLAMLANHRRAARTQARPA